MIDIFYATFLYILFAFICSLFLDKYVFTNFDEEKEKKKSIILLILELCGLIGLIGVISYIFRNIAHFYFFPFEGYYGFSHYKVSEVKSGGLFTAYVLILNVYLQQKLSIIKSKLLDKKIKK
jgi:hypothetical protein